MAADLKTFLVAMTLFQLATALQVTPNSPCASFCLDADETDSQSSATNASDISCKDDDFATKVQGRRYQRCMTCLQDSDFSEGDESDQQWFLYNLRYSFGYCIFGFPNATGIDASPCITSEACGPLGEPFEQGILDPSKSEPYGYCTAHGGVSLGEPFDKCLQCVHASSDQYYLSNFLIALEAGCRQQPTPGTIVGLNDTVFSRTAVEIVDPNYIPGAEADAGSGLPTAAIAGIVAGAVVLLALIGGCTFMQLRKRKNRAALARAAEPSLASPMSFRCRTRVTPLDAEFPFNQGLGISEKPYVDPAAALSSNPYAANASHSFQDKFSSANLSHITTSIPRPSPSLSSPHRFSPEDYTTPTSTTSTRSNAPLLQHRPYVPSEYAGSPPTNSVATFQNGRSLPSPRLDSPSNMRLGPFSERKEASPISSWDPSTTVSYTRPLTSGRRSPRGVGTPVETLPIQKTFPPPPKK